MAPLLREQEATKIYSGPRSRRRGKKRRIPVSGVFLESRRAKEFPCETSNGYLFRIGYSGVCDIDEDSSSFVGIFLFFLSFFFFSFLLDLDALFYHGDMNFRPSRSKRSIFCSLAVISFYGLRIKRDSDSSTKGAWTLILVWCYWISKTMTVWSFSISQF